VGAVADVVGMQGLVDGVVELRLGHVHVRLEVVAEPQVVDVAPGQVRLEAQLVLGDPRVRDAAADLAARQVVGHEVDVGVVDLGELVVRMQRELVVVHVRLLVLRQPVPIGQVGVSGGSEQARDGEHGDRLLHFFLKERGNKKPGPAGAGLLR